MLEIGAVIRMIVLWGIGTFISLTACVIMLLPFFYFLGYIIDCIIFLINKLPKMKECSFWNKLTKKGFYKEIYLRYETPLITYSFSFLPIFFLFSILNGNYTHRIAISILGYLLSCLIGMKSKYAHNKDKYKEVIQNNIEFLQLSFLPIGFFITMYSFFCSDSVMDKWNIESICEFFSKRIIHNMKNYAQFDTFSNLVKWLFYLLKTLFLLYLISLPIQAIAYFLLHIVIYFQKYITSYKEMLKKYGRILLYWRKK